MYPNQHLISGIILGGILFYLFPEITIIGFFLIIASTVLIDVDHYIFYVGITKDWSLKNAYNWFREGEKKFKELSREEKRELRHAFYIFHGVEPLIIAFFVSYYLSPYFYFILIGMGLHMILDISFGIYHQYGFHKVFLMYDVGRFDESRMIHNKK